MVYFGTEDKDGRSVMVLLSADVTWELRIRIHSCG